MGTKVKEKKILLHMSLFFPNYICVSNTRVQDTEDHHQAATEPDTVHHPTSEEVTAENQASSGPAARPTRVKMKRRWNGGPEWVR